MEYAGSSHNNAIFLTKRKDSVRAGAGHHIDGILGNADLAALHAVKRCTSAVKDTVFLPE